MLKPFGSIATSPTAIGFLSGAGAVLPLLGRFSGISSSALALLILAITLLVLFTGRKQTALEPAAVLLILAVSGFTATVFLSASYQQLTFLLSPQLWPLRENSYIEAKLLSFSISFAVPFLFGIIIVNSPDTSQTVNSAITGIVVVASLAVVRVLSEDGARLLGTNYLVAHEFFNDPKLDYSIVSYGFLFALGATGSLLFRNGWLSAGLFLFMAILLSRRAETFLIIIALAVFYIWRYFATGHATNLRQLLLGLIVGFALALALHNGHNTSYFLQTWQGAQQRVDLISSVVNNSSTTQSSDSMNTGSTAKTVNSVRPAGEKESSKRFWTGEGLGQFANLNPIQKYPHNIVLEAFFELGIASVAFLFFVAAYPYWVLGGQILQGKERKSALCAAAMFAIVFALTLKAGDITNFGRITFLSLLLVMASSIDKKGPNQS